MEALNGALSAVLGSDDMAVIQSVLPPIMGEGPPPKKARLPQWPLSEHREEFNVRHGPNGYEMFAEKAVSPIPALLPFWLLRLALGEEKQKTCIKNMLMCPSTDVSLAMKRIRRVIANMDDEDVKKACERRGMSPGGDDRWRLCESLMRFNPHTDLRGTHQLQFVRAIMTNVLKQKYNVSNKQGIRKALDAIVLAYSNKHGMLPGVRVAVYNPDENGCTKWIPNDANEPNGPAYVITGHSASRKSDSYDNTRCFASLANSGLPRGADVFEHGYEHRTDIAKVISMGCNAIFTEEDGYIELVVIKPMKKGESVRAFYSWH